MRTQAILLVITIFAISLFPQLSFSDGSDKWLQCGDYTDCGVTASSQYRVGCFYDSAAPAADK